jgi:hypothetical protein
MTEPPTREFGKRRPVVAQAAAAPPVKRSRHVALLLMGTFAMGGGAYALMPRENCEPKSPGMAAPALPPTSTECSSRGSSGGGHGGYWSRRSSFFGGDSSPSSSSSGTTSESGVTRGGFGSFARSFASHFSFGG